MEKCDARLSIFGEIGSGAIGGVASGLTESAVVVTECGNAMTGEVVGDDCEWLVVEECLIAILQAATRHHEETEARPRPLPKGGGQGEGACEGVRGESCDRVATNGGGSR